MTVTVQITVVFAREVNYRLFKCPPSEESLNHNKPGYGKYAIFIKKEIVMYILK